MTLLLALFAGQAKPVFDFDVRSGSGLSLTVSGVPVVSSSSFQYYENGWIKGYYSSNNGGQEVKRIDPDTVGVTFAGADGQATGKILYHREGSHLKVHYDLHWMGDEPAEIELGAGLIEAQSLQAGTLNLDGVAARSLRGHDYSGPGDFESRRYGHDAKEFRFDSPLAKVVATTSLPSTLFDARGYGQDYATGKDIWWLGPMKLDISKQTPVQFDVDWLINPTQVESPKSEKVQLVTTPVPDALSPSERIPILVPRPTANQLTFERTLTYTGHFSWPAGHVRFWEGDLVSGLSRRFQVPKIDPSSPPIKVDGGVSKLGLHPGGYQITIKEGSISVLGEEDEGLHNGLRRLVQLAFVRKGKIVFPTGYLMNSPKIVWRGVHLFVGPEALAFQQKLWNRVLLPLGFNKVILQCERTQWDCMPNLRTKDMMTKADLAKLFEYYRSVGVEPIPLIQSFGHMEWFFKGQQNLDLAVNPSVPYTIDPRKPKTKGALETLWTEACSLLKPETLHFGCDEVDMLGFPLKHADLMTELWKLQMPVLGDIAKQHGAKMMIWGDEGLAPKEAIDATSAESKEESAKRRSAIPKAAWIADWHYKADTKPELFLPSLQLWKQEGHVPIASSWFQPDNIRSFGLAADVEHTGTLQTTWAGYSSDEKAMEQNIDQFSAMVLSAEYSWSSRFDSVSKLGYDPAQIFRDLYYTVPRPVVARPGYSLYAGSKQSDLVIGDLKFSLGEPIKWRSVLTAPDAPSTWEMTVSGKGSHLGFALNTMNKCPIGESVARVEVSFKDGKTQSLDLVYGKHVRASDDVHPCTFAETKNGISVFEVSLADQTEIKAVRIDATNTYAGLALHGMLVR